MNMNFSLAFRFRKASGEYVLVPEYVTEGFASYVTQFGSISFQSLTKDRDAFGYSIAPKVSRVIGEAVEYAGEFGGVINTEGRTVLGME